MIIVQMDVIKNYVEKVLERDMADNLLSVQQKKWGPYIRNPLPVDSASSNTTVIFTQLLKTVGNAADDFIEVMRGLSETQQDGSIICAAAASGMGKTHLAYDVGQRHFTILIKVMDNSGECNGDQTSAKSPPWDEALRMMKDAGQLWTNNHDAAGRAKSMLRVVHLLLYAYIEFTLTALQHAQIDDMSRRKEFVLRIHRNGTADDLIHSLFCDNVKRLRAAHDDTEVFICETKFNEYRKNLLLLSMNANGFGIPSEEKLILCVDEINGLANDFTVDFVSQKVANVSPGLLSLERPESQQGLMYAVFCVLKALMKRTPSLVCFVTGTALSVATFRNEIDGISVARGSIVALSPSHLHSVEDMVHILSHYFYWEKDALDILRTKLAPFQGRPLFFARGVFEPLVHRLPGTSALECLSTTSMNDFSWLKHDMLVNFYKRIYINTFGSNTRSLLDEMKSMNSLLPHVIRAHLSGGVYTAATRDLLEGAIYTAILPMGVTTTEREDYYKIDLNREPIIREAIAGLVSHILTPENGCQRLLSIFSDTGGGEKGLRAVEWLFAMHIVLQVERAHLRLKKVSLTSICTALLPETQHGFLSEELSDYEVQCRRIVDMDDDEHLTIRSFLHKFVKEDGSFDYDVILINIDEFAGVDIAFLVKTRLDVTRVVAVQANNKVAAALDESLLALSPGCQYLTNEERVYFLHKKYDEGRANSKLPTNRSITVGFNSPVCCDHRTICTTYSELGSGWIRVSLNARPVSDKLLQTIADLCQERHSLQSTWTRGNTKRSLISTSLQNSPLVVLSMGTPTYLTNVGRDRLIIDQKAKGALKPPKEFRRWVELKVEDVAVGQRTAK